MEQATGAGRLLSLATRASLVIALLGCLLGVLAPAEMQRVGLIILGLGLALGLPHGAVDHLLPFWRGWLRRGPASMGAVLSGYLLLAVATFVVLQAIGRWALIVLLLLSMVHFGLGDLMADPGAGPARWATDQDGSRLGSGGVNVTGVIGFVVAVTARGGIVLVGPMLGWPGTTMEALRGIAPGITAPGAVLRWVAGSVVLGCVAWSVATAIRRSRRSTAIELVVVNLLFLVVPPLAAFGLYFGGWHGLRHTARMIAEQPANRVDLCAGRWTRPVGRFVVAAAGPTAVAGLGVIGLVLLARHGTDFAAPAFSALFALTVPHLVIVAILDLQQTFGSRFGVHDRVTGSISRMG